MSLLVIKNLVHSFGSHPALAGVDLQLRGDSLTILGPSGCGKTTLLRIVAGLQKPDGGQVWIDGCQVNGPGLYTPPRHRSVGMIFQNLALWPHMTVEKNISLGLKSMGLSRSEQRKKTGEMLNKMQMIGFEKKYPEILSAGEQQRVALARSMVLEPKLLLLDEPFAHLDLSLREEMISLVRELDATTVFVTHDQMDAACMGGMIAVMKEGAIEQTGIWDEIVTSPATEFVKSFIKGPTVRFLNRQEPE